MKLFTTVGLRDAGLTKRCSERCDPHSPRPLSHWLLDGGRCCASREFLHSHLWSLAQLAPTWCPSLYASYVVRHARLQGPVHRPN
jgi:hypothetical protein